MALWATGFSFCAAGLSLLQSAVPEHENDRIHAIIHTLPPALASLVERLVPEEEWQTLGLQGMSERRLCKRIEALVAERVLRQKRFQAAFEASALLAYTGIGGFAGDVYEALVRYEKVPSSGDGETLRLERS
jgi:hypothetical protein